MNFKSKFLTVAAKLTQHQNTTFRDLPIVIEWPKGSVRVGEDKNGKKWHRKMEADYGFIPDTTAAGDQENLDVYVGTDEEADSVYVIEQLKEDGEFDEYKVMLGFPDLDTALETYLKHYPDGWEDDRVGDVSEVPFDYVFDKVEEHQEKQEKTASKGELRDYAWMWDTRNGEFFFAPGDYSSHAQNFVHDNSGLGRADDPVPPGKVTYQNYTKNCVRGYAHVNPDTKVVEIGLTGSGELHYFPKEAVSELKHKFPGYSIEERGIGPNWRKNHWHAPTQTFYEQLPVPAGFSAPISASKTAKFCGLAYLKALLSMK